MKKQKEIVSEEPIKTKPPKMKNKKWCPICGSDEFIKDNGSPMLECTNCLSGFKIIK